jgi:hypothetical protein
MTAHRMRTAAGLVLCALTLSACMDQRVVVDIDPAGSYTVTYEHGWDLDALDAETAERAAPLDPDEFWRRYTPIDHPEFDGACGYLAVFSEGGPLVLVPDDTFSQARESFHADGSWRVSSCDSGPLPWPEERFDDTPGTSIEVRQEGDVYTFELRIDRNAVQRLTRSDWYGALNDAQAEAFFGQSVTYIVRGPGELLFHPNGQQLDERTVAWQVTPDTGPFLLRASWVYETVETLPDGSGDQSTAGRSPLMLLAVVVALAGGGWWWRRRSSEYEYEYEDDGDAAFDHQPGHQQYHQFDQSAHQGATSGPFGAGHDDPDPVPHRASVGSTPAGWYQDPGDPSGWRWWDGQRWGQPWDGVSAR